MKAIKIKRIYEDADSSDGYRILIDRLWPRGISKGDAKLDEWNKELAPSTELRKWFDHTPERFEEFKKRYREELKSQEDELKRLHSLAKSKTVTLLYAAKDENMNNAVVLREILTQSNE
ncbi:MAG: DUF488 domain-containing protein [Lentimicrobium sp.]|jgi:uncharacterized protein YeaO (DUF488 family)|nr:DUF488 domain-containing protein [Lentimicrobium sp.]MDD2528329.1 DUF488 domain-containing protein [Lentimicrobiaceae bacterium]MDD4599262.1 DUF488 domain-containing protein [Lentimicrobiaceae bacterium]MDY0026159.1 DUF488 domain-containing protein [Lentimicrobium sp.]